MKLLMWHCSRLRSSDVRRSNRPRGIRSLLSKPTTVEFKNVLVAFACIEQGDTDRTIAAAVEEILRQSEHVRRRNVVVVPFAHLSSKLMTDSEGALALIVLLSNSLREAGLEVETNSFGYHKQFELHYVAKGYPGSVAFREVTADGVIDPDGPQGAD